MVRNTTTTMYKLRFLSFTWSLNRASSSSALNVNWRTLTNQFLINFWWTLTLLRFELIFCTYFCPSSPVMPPQRHAPTTTHTSNTVTNFDVAVLILSIKRSQSKTKCMLSRSHSYRIGVFEFASTNINRTVRLTNECSENIIKCIFVNSSFRSYIYRRQSWSRCYKSKAKMIVASHQHDPWNSFWWDMVLAQKCDWYKSLAMSSPEFPWLTILNASKSFKRKCIWTWANTVGDNPFARAVDIELTLSTITVLCICPHRYLSREGINQINIAARQFHAWPQSKSSHLFTSHKIPVRIE